MFAVGGTFTRSVLDVDPDDFPEDGGREDRAVFLLRYAVLAPSSHNSQPWRFGVGADGDAIHVRADRDRWFEAADLDERELHLSLGCAVENLVVAARRFGCDPDVTVHGDAQRSAGETVATVVLRRDGAVDAAPPDTSLFDAITQRCTNHGLFEGSRLDRADRGALQAAAARPDSDADEAGAARADPSADGEPAAGDVSATGVDPDVGLHFVEDRDAIAAIAEMQRHADAAQFADPDYRRELGELIGDGALGAAWLKARLGELAVTHLDLGEREGRRHTELIASAPAVGLVTTAGDDVASRLAAGRGLERAWLRATARDVALHPINQVLAVDEMRDEVSALAGVQDRRLQLLCRVGYAEPEETRRPRRPLADVVEDEATVAETLKEELDAIEDANAHVIYDAHLDRLEERLDTATDD